MVFTNRFRHPMEA